MRFPFPSVLPRFTRPPLGCKSAQLTATHATEKPGQQAGGTESAIYEKLDVILLHLTCALSQVCRVLAVALAAALAALLVALLAALLAALLGACLLVCLLACCRLLLLALLLCCCFACCCRYCCCACCCVCRCACCCACCCTCCQKCPWSPKRASRAETTKNL